MIQIKQYLLTGYSLTLALALSGCGGESPLSEESEPMLTAQSAYVEESDKESADSEKRGSRKDRDKEQDSKEDKDDDDDDEREERKDQWDDSDDDEDDDDKDEREDQWEESEDDNDDERNRGGGNTTLEIVTSYQPDAGRLLGSQCAQCHGTNGVSVTRWDSIAGEGELEHEIYEDDSPIMTAQAHGYTSEEVTLIGNWLKTLPNNDD